MANPTKADKAAAKTANASAANEARNAPAKEAGKFETVADFQRKYPGVNMAEFLEQVGIEHGLISRS